MKESALREYVASSKVRYGRCRSSPELLIAYLDENNAVAMQLCREAARNLYLQATHVLLETICDELIAKCWRCWCLDNIYRPLACLHKLNQTEEECRELIHIQTKVRVFSFYFLN